MNNNTLTPRQGRQLTKDLIDCVHLDETLLEYIIDYYVYLINDTEVEKMQNIVNNEFGVLS